MIIAVNGCKDTASVTVDDIRNNPIAKVSATPDDLLDCVIDEITLLGSAEGTFNANLVWISGGNVYTPGTVLQVEDPGTYQFVIVDTLTHCSDTAIMVINENLVYPPLFVDPPGTLTCSNPTIQLSGGSVFPGIQYKWATISGIDTTIIGTGTSITVSTAGTYWIFGLDPQNQCKNSLSVSVTANQVYPVADAGNGFTMKCFGETANLDGTGSNSLGTITFLWSTSNGNFVTGANSATPLISKPGTYKLVVTDPANGCSDTDEVVVAPIDPTATATVVQPPCYGDKGSIEVDEVIGGVPPVEFSLNNGPFTTQNFFPNLPPGPYTLVVQDAEGCSTTLSAVLVEPDEFQILVTPEVKIDLGETYEIITIINVPLSDIQSVQWTPSTGLSCDTCLNLVAAPFISTQYKVEVTTEAGCRDDAVLRLLVNRQVDVYIPNVFSPNGDGENDRFTVYADLKGVSKIHYLQVYSRWGELLWEREHFQPNLEELGWDGKYKDQDMNPAVFVYQALIEFIDGRKELFKGDVTIER
jgi:gliding motility-associated-like protein